MHGEMKGDFLKMKDIYIVTGAAGHLGSTIANLLNNQGKTVFALCLPNETHLPAGENVKVFFGDVCDVKSIEEQLFCNDRQNVTVIHCAGIVSISSKFDKNVYNVNVNGTKNIISLCEKYHVKKLVYISSVHAIPELPTSEAISEVNHFSPDDVNGLYAKTKAEATQCVLDYKERGGNVNVVHPSGIMGPGNSGKNHLIQMIIDYCKGWLFSGVDGGYDFVDVRDVAEGVLSCCEKGKNGECYILSGKYYKVIELLDMLHEITGKKKIKSILPLWFVKLTAPLSELYYKILKQPPLFTAYSIQTLNTNAIFNNTKAKKVLGYSTRPLKQTLIDTMLWLRAENRIS